MTVNSNKTNGTSQSNGHANGSLMVSEERELSKLLESLHWSDGPWQPLTRTLIWLTCDYCSHSSPLATCRMCLSSCEKMIGLLCVASRR